jgi:uncharacterized membrane protein
VGHDPVPCGVAYERLSHLENYPQFMSGVKEVTQLSDTMAHWVMDLGGQQQEFDAQITDQRPGERLARVVDRERSGCDA